MRVIPALLTALAAISLCAAASAAPKPEECLKCHGGTLESLAAQTKNYKAPSGETVNPHVYIDKLAANPHKSKVLPDCLKCHTDHGIPPDKSKIKPANVDYCYGCHHMENFQKCSSSGCHEGR